MADSELRILVADDHPLVRGALKQALQGIAAENGIAEAGTFDDVSKILTENDQDLVLLDLSMPGVQGFSGLIYLRAQHPATPVIIVSGNEDRAVIRRCIEFGASGFIPKSVDVDTMRAAIRAETGLETELSTTGGTSDGRFIAQICPQVIELGPPNATIHKVNECVAVADIEPLKNIYRRVMEQLAGVPGVDEVTP